MLQALLDLIAREHPAFVHIPLGLVVTLPLILLVSYAAKDPRAWVRKALFAAGVAWVGSFGALLSGLLWARQINLVPPGRLLPMVTGGGQALQRVMWRHEVAAAAGVLLGLACLALLLEALDRPRLRAAALGVSLLWAGAWAFTGRQGGVMVFGNDELNKAAAAADAAKRNDAEADLPIRALDFASLDPVRLTPSLSKAHGAHWAQVWVTASGSDAYQAGKDLPVGAFAVLSTYLDVQGRPGFEPGPLYMRETRKDGTQAFAFYWSRVPEARRGETGGQDSVYWRSPAPQLAACARCHATAGPAKAD
jgi:uncharacterized membrane protein